MKTIVIAVAALLLLASPVMAGQCPTLIKQLNEAVDKTKDETKVTKVKVLIADAQKFHDGKQHADAIAKCDQAADVLGIKLKKK